MLTFAGMSMALAAGLIGQRATRPSSFTMKAAESPTSVQVNEQEHPDWIYGRSDARFVIVGYADFSCPYCREYFPMLRQWVSEHPEANWQWHHLPLSLHEPQTTEAARLAECAGEVSGNTAFWNAAFWLFQHTPGADEQSAADMQLPGMSTAIQQCLRSNQPDARIRAQAEAAARDEITVTPTLRLIDRESGNTLTLRGPVSGDALLSAIDLLGAPANDKVIPMTSVNNISK